MHFRGGFPAQSSAFNLQSSCATADVRDGREFSMRGPVEDRLLISAWAAAAAIFGLGLGKGPYSPRARRSTLPWPRWPKYSLVFSHRRSMSQSGAGCHCLHQAQVESEALESITEVMKL